MTQTVNIEGVGKVNFPDDYTPDRIKFSIENDILPRIKKSGGGGDFSQPEKPPPLARIGRGFMDVAQGVKQGGLMLKDAITGSEDAAAYTKEKTAEEALYERGRGPDAGIDLLRLSGNVLGTAPAALIPGAGAATLGARAASGAAQGAAASASMFTPEGQSKLEQTLIGAGVGAAVPAVIAGGKKALQSLSAKVSQGRVIDVPEVQREITLQLQQHGVDFNKLTAEVQKSLLDDAQKALNIGGNLNPAQLARKADIESVGAKGTQAAITRNPKDWQTQQNMRPITGVGEGIGKRQADDAAAMVDYLGRLRQQTGGRATTAFEAGEAPIKALQAADEARSKVVDDLYEAYRAHGQKDATVPATKIADVMGRVADEMGLNNIPFDVRERLKEFGLMGGKQTKLLTINEADKLNKLINNNNPGRGTPGARALQPIKEALNDALLDIPEKGASEALLTARKAAADMFAERRASAGVTAAIDDVAPDRFVKRFIMDAPVKDMRETLAKVKAAPGGQQAMADIKGHLFDNLLLKATGATNIDDVAGRPFSGRNFSKALDGIAPEKLHQIFSPSELDALNTLRRASKALTEEVPFSDVSYGTKVGNIANLLMKVGQTPMLGQLVSPIIGAGKIGADWVKNAADRKAVAEMLLTSAAKAGDSAPRIKSIPNHYRVEPAAAASAFTDKRDD